MASSPPRSPHLSVAPSLKRTRRTPEISSTVNYMYQSSCPDGCISKSAAVRNYKLKESDFEILQPAKVVPNPHCPTKKVYWFQRTEIESYITQRNKVAAAGVTKVTAVAKGGSRPRKKSSEAGTPSSPVKILRKKIQGFAFNTEDIGGITPSTRDTLNSKEDKPPVRKKRRVTIASIEILDDGSVLDLPIERD